MSVTYVIGFDVVPAQRERFLALLNGVLDAMSAEKNFHRAFLHADPDNPHRFLLYETWESHEDVLNIQLHRPYRVAWHAALPELLARERDVQVLVPLTMIPERRVA